MRYYSGIFSCYGNDERKLDHNPEPMRTLARLTSKQFSILVECSLLEVAGAGILSLLCIFHQTAKRIDALAIKNRKLVRY